MKEGKCRYCGRTLTLVNGRWLEDKLTSFVETACPESPYQRHKVEDSR